MEKNGWNEAMKRTVLVTHNFDVMSGKAGNGFELVALVKTLDRLQGVYTATDPEKRFHDWAASMYDIPANATDIDVRIDEIKNELGPDLVSQAVAAFDEQARHGNVPNVLIANDTEYWIITAGIAMCSYDPDCDSTFMKKVRDERLHERAVPDGLPITRTSYTVLDYFLPMAHAAWRDARHHTYLYAEPVDCNYGVCKVSDGEIATGTFTFSLSVGKNSRGMTGHAFGNTVDIYVGSCGTGTNAGSVYNVVRAEFQIIVTHWRGFDVGYGCATDSVMNLRLGDMNPNAGWIWYLRGTSNAYTNR